MSDPEEFDKNLNILLMTAVSFPVLFLIGLWVATLLK